VPEARWLAEAAVVLTAAAGRSVAPDVASDMSCTDTLEFFIGEAKAVGSSGNQMAALARSPLGGPNNRARRPDREVWQQKYSVNVRFKMRSPNPDVSVNSSVSGDRG
jgi:hypothetical protein